MFHAGELTYEARANVLEKPRLWRLDAHALRWNSEHGEQSFEFTKITKIRLAWDPSRSNAAQYGCHISVASGWTETIPSTSYQGFADFENRGEDYRQFVVALIGRVANVNPACSFVSGATGLGYYGNIAILAASAVAVVGTYAIVTFDGWRAIAAGLLLFLALPTILFHWVAANKPRPLNIPELLKEGTAEGVLPPVPTSN